MMTSLVKLCPHWPIDIQFLVNIQCCEITNYNRVNRKCFFTLIISAKKSSKEILHLTHQYDMFDNIYHMI